MPDTNVKVFKGEFPDQDYIGKMRLGEKVLWIPDAEHTRMGCNPVLYILELSKWKQKPRPILMPYFPVPLLPNG